MQGNQTDTRRNDIATTARTLTTIHTDTELAALTPEWNALCATLPLQHPFAEPDWNLHWWRHLRARRLLIHDRLHAFALRDAHGKLVAVAPMMISVRRELMSPLWAEEGGVRPPRTALSSAGARGRQAN